jgi:hypothetical protein
MHFMSPSRVVTIVDDIEVMEFTKDDPDGFILEKWYYVHGVKHATLTEARESAKKIAKDTNGHQ